MCTRVYHNFRFYVASCVTGVFAQNTCKLIAYHPVPFTNVGQQLEAILGDFDLNGLYISHLPDETTVKLISGLLAEKPIHPALFDVSILHPLGVKTADMKVIEAFMEHLIPHVDTVVCNRKEAELILGQPVEDIASAKEAANKLHETGCRQVVITSSGQDSRAMDVVHDRLGTKLADAPQVATDNTLGRGTLFSSCVLGYVVKGEDLYEAVTKAKLYIRKAMSHNFKIGQGKHPLNLNTPL